MFITEVIMMETPGKKLSDFHLQGELGRGSFAVVHKVKSLLNNKVYVLKQVNLQHLSMKNQQLAKQEVEILKSVSHPNIVKCYGSFLENSCLYIILEFAEEGDLQKLMHKYKQKTKSFKEQEIWQYAEQLSSAINYLHSRRILHRDIKCPNVFLTGGKLKLGDLGTSRIMQSEMHVTRVGTPLYLAPELIKNQPYDTKVDVWAMGCILYTLAAMRPPFSGQNLITLGVNIISHEPKPLPSTYSKKLSSFISKLLIKQAKTRPSIAEVIDLLPKNPDKTFSEIDLLSTGVTWGKLSNVDIPRPATQQVHTRPKESFGPEVGVPREKRISQLFGKFKSKIEYLKSVSREKPQDKPKGSFQPPEPLELPEPVEPVKSVELIEFPGTQKAPRIQKPPKSFLTEKPPKKEESQKPQLVQKDTESIFRSNSALLNSLTKTKENSSQEKKPTQTKHESQKEFRPQTAKKYNSKCTAKNQRPQTAKGKSNWAPKNPLYKPRDFSTVQKPCIPTPFAQPLPPKAHKKLTVRDLHVN